MWWIKRVWNKWNLILVVCFAFFIYYWTWQKQNPILEILGGIPDYGQKNIEILPLGKWLFLLAFFFFISCKEMHTELKTWIFELYRYQSFKLWWRRHFWGIHLITAQVFLIAYLIWTIFGRMNMQLEVAIIFYLHLSSLISILLVADYISTTKIIPCVMLIIEGVGYVLSVNYDVPWIVCGMYNRSIFSRQDGFGLEMIIVEVFVTWICYKLVPILWGKDGRERKES